MDVRVLTPQFHAPDGAVLEPELLAAVFARYSRTGDGLERILSEAGEQEGLAERILRFIDYGHASIGGLTGGIPVGCDGVSMLTPYLSFFLQSKQDGQETSTRYCEFTPDGLASPLAFGIPEEFRQEWYEVLSEGFALSRAVWEELDGRVRQNPGLASIPEGAGKRVAARMRRNYGFDRARYLMPLAALTNFGLIMTGREWAETLRFLAASPVPEQRFFAQAVRPALEEFLPHLMKHAHTTSMSQEYMRRFFARGAAFIRKEGVRLEAVPDTVVTQVQLPTEEGLIDGSVSVEERFAQAFMGKVNRYDIPRGFPEKVHVAVYWPSMTIAEARDINRQRPCQKDTLLAPHGFYLPPEAEDALEERGLRGRFDRMQRRRARLLSALASSRHPSSYTGALLLGDQTPFELHTNAAHMTYVLELRTGKGAHFRYSELMQLAYDSFAKQLPVWTKHVVLGSAEPE